MFTSLFKDFKVNKQWPCSIFREALILPQPPPTSAGITGVQHLHGLLLFILVTIGVEVDQNLQVVLVPQLSSAGVSRHEPLT